MPACDVDNVMCRYRLINQEECQTIMSIRSSTNDNEDIKNKPRIFSFNHEQVKLNELLYSSFSYLLVLFFALCKEYTFTVTNNFILTCFESALSIEVWYHYNSIPLSINTAASSERNRRDAEIRALSNRWKEVKRHIQYAVEIHELDASGRWEPVEVDAQQPQIISGGVYRLRQVNKNKVFNVVHSGLFSSYLRIGPIETFSDTFTCFTSIRYNATGTSCHTISRNWFDKYTKN